MSKTKLVVFCAIAFFLSLFHQTVSAQEIHVTDNDTLLKEEIYN